MTRHHFRITGAASPDLPLRILNLFAQLDLAFERCAIDREGDRYIVAVEHHDLPPAKADIIAGKIAAMVLVESAELHSVPAGLADQ